MLKIVNNFQGTFRYYTANHLNCLIQEEFLFTNPGGDMFHDKNNKKYFIGHNGYGRYVPNTLEIIDNQTGELLERNTDYKEHDNGISYEFTSPLPSNRIYKDYTVKYLVRPEDFAFSNNITLSNPEFQRNIRSQLSKHCNDYKVEEYFLFPNWIGAPGCGDGFWVGKYMASTANATASGWGTIHLNDNEFPAQSKKGIYALTGQTLSVYKTLSIRKGNGFHLMKNREWMNIAYWCLHHNIDNLITNTALSDPVKKTYTEIYKTGEMKDNDPSKTRHNLQYNGIADMIGPYAEFVDGIGIDWIGSGTGSSIYLYDYTEDYTEYNEKTYIPKINSSVEPLKSTDFLLSPTNKDMTNYVNDSNTALWNIYFEDNNYKYEGIPTNNAELNTLPYNREATNGEYFKFSNTLTTTYYNPSAPRWYGAKRSGSYADKYRCGLFYLSLTTNDVSSGGGGDKTGFRLCRDIVES